MILLEELDTEFGQIKITKSKLDGSCTYFQGACFHSQINAEGVSTSGYVHVMYSIIRQSRAWRVLMIGCAGGTLSTMLHRLGCKVTVVDINSHAFTLAKKYFQMPEEIECVVDDGWSYLLKTEGQYDAIAIDAFNPDATVPAQFTTEDFFMRVKEAIEPCGIVTMNVMVEHDIDMLADRIALNMESAKIPTVLFDRPGKLDRNVIIAGGVAEQIEIHSSKKPYIIRRELRGIIQRKPRKRATKGFTRRFQ